MKSYDELALTAARRIIQQFARRARGWAIEQNAGYELAQFWLPARNKGVQSVLEIGTGYRAGLARFLHDDKGLAGDEVDIHDHQFAECSSSSIQAQTCPVTEATGNTADLVIIDADHLWLTGRRVTDRQVFKLGIVAAPS